MTALNSSLFWGVCACGSAVTQCHRGEISSQEMYDDDDAVFKNRQMHMGWDIKRTSETLTSPGDKGPYLLTSSTVATNKAATAVWTCSIWRHTPCKAVSTFFPLISLIVCVYILLFYTCVFHSTPQYKEAQELVFNSKLYENSRVPLEVSQRSSDDSKSSFIIISH